MRIDLYDSQEINIYGKRTARVLESGDNPISSISSKAGLVSFKAFQTDNSHKHMIEEQIVIPTNNEANNSSLAEMFKTKKQNMMNKFKTRDKCKSKVRPDKKPKTKQQLLEIRKNMMKRHRSTSPITDNQGKIQRGKDNSTIDVKVDDFRGANKSKVTQK